MCLIINSIDFKPSERTNEISSGFVSDLLLLFYFAFDLYSSRDYTTSLSPNL